MMSSESSVDFGFEGDTCSGTDFNFSHGYLASGHGEIDLQVENDLSTSQLELVKVGHRIAWHIEVLRIHVKIVYSCRQLKPTN